MIKLYHEPCSIPALVNDCLNAVIQLKPVAPKHTLSNFGRGKYVIKFSEANRDLVGTSTADGRVIKLEEIIRVHYIEDNGELSDKVHGLLLGQEVHKRLTEKFEMIGWWED